jgi:class 3 adenylate cyclase
MARAKPQLQLVTLGGVSFEFTVVFAAVFAWVYANATKRATDRLRGDLDDTLRGAAASIDAEELVALYREGTPNPAGFSDDPRYARIESLFEIVHRVEPRAWPYTFVRGGAEDTRRVGPKKGDPEFVYVVDLWARYDAKKATKFLSSDTGSEWSQKAWDTGALVERPGTYGDAYGTWMTSYAAVRDLNGNVVAVMGVDFEASEIRKVQRDLSRALVALFFAAYAGTIALTYLASAFIERKKKIAPAPEAPKTIVVKDEPKPPEAERRPITVVQAEILGVRELAETSTAVGVHHVLDDLLASFDALARRHGLERIETSGQAYTVVGGLEGDARAEDACDMALAMLDEARPKDGISLRIGVHRGDVVVARAGRGHEIFGDAVRVASRLEKSGAGGRVHVSTAIADAVRDSFRIEPDDASSAWLTSRGGRGAPARSDG